MAKAQSSNKASSSNNPSQSKVDFALIFTVVSFIMVAIGILLLPNNFQNEWIFEGQERHANKPFKSLNEFYPFYLSEHADVNNRIFHFIGTSLVIIALLFSPLLIHCLGIAFGLAYISSTLFAFHPTGAFEGAILASVFFFFAAINKHLKKAIFIVVLGYFFAWVGHFRFEHNYPATFIYPSYSLLSDFRMWVDMLQGQVSGLAELKTLIMTLDTQKVQQQAVGLYNEIKTSVTQLINKQ